MKAVNRFASTLAGTFRSFYLYNQDNKAFDEILQNLVKRFQDTQASHAPIEFTITNRSLLYKGESIGFADVTVALASLLRNLGYKSIRFQAPIQSRHFFQLLHVITGKDSTESKNEKLIPLIADGEPKPVSLVPLTAHSYLIKLSDEAIMGRLAALRVPQAQGGTGFLEKISKTNFSNSADFLLWARRESELFTSESLQTFTKSFIEATQKGYFPWDRFVKIFPGAKSGQAHWEKAPLSKWSLFMSSDIRAQLDLRNAGSAASASQDLDLASRLMAEAGSSNFTLGLSLLLRSMSEKNPMGTQEKALRLATNVWLTCDNALESVPFFSLLSSLREKLSSPANIVLTLFSVRNSSVDTPLYIETTKYLRSLGAACLPALIKALGEEQDRGLRKKILSIIPEVAREDGADILVGALSAAPPFLLRNIILILGDIKATSAIPAIVPFLTHNQVIVRQEAVRTLTKMGTEEAKHALERAAR